MPGDNSIDAYIHDICLVVIMAEVLARRPCRMFALLEMVPENLAHLALREKERLRTK